MGSVRSLVALAMAVLTALAFTAPAQAAPECTDIAPNTRLCTTGPGHSAIVTSPDPAFTNPFPGWGFGGLGYGFSMGGVWMGI